MERHRVACDGFARVADLVRADRWANPTPCTEWDARAVVEHVIGFHEFLLLRPLGVRAHRPKEGPADRWSATAVATGVDAHLDPDLCERALAALGTRDPGGADALVGPAVAVAPAAPLPDRLVARYGRDPYWVA